MLSHRRRSDFLGVKPFVYGWGCFYLVFSTLDGVDGGSKMQVSGSGAFATNHWSLARVDEFPQNGRFAYLGRVRILVIGELHGPANRRVGYCRKPLQLTQRAADQLLHGGDCAVA